MNEGRKASMRPAPPRSASAKRAVLKAVVSRLADAYPEASCALTHRNAYELLAATILSAQCTDERVNLVTPRLFAAYPSPADLARATPKEVEEIIYSTGFYRAKARSLIGMAHGAVERFGGSIPSTMEELVTLPGVGRKTANVVLGVACGVPGFPVDTHVIRLVTLLKLSRGTDAVKIEREICALVPKEEWTHLSLRLILHGRKVCIANRPRCQECVLADLCPSAFPSKR